MNQKQSELIGPILWVLAFSCLAAFADHPINPGVFNENYGLDAQVSINNAKLIMQADVRESGAN